jgi:hypothetical protein
MTCADDDAERSDEEEWETIHSFSSCAQSLDRGQGFVRSLMCLNTRIGSQPLKREDLEQTGELPCCRGEIRRGSWLVGEHGQEIRAASNIYLLCVWVAAVQCTVYFLVAGAHSGLGVGYSLFAEGGRGRGLRTRDRA